VIWAGDSGTDIFFQNEMPYDPPTQLAWMEAPGVDGWAAFKVTENVRTFNGYGMGSYSFFVQGVTIYAANASRFPQPFPRKACRDLLTGFSTRTLIEFGREPLLLFLKDQLNTGHELRNHAQREPQDHSQPGASLIERESIASCLPRSMSHPYANSNFSRLGCRCPRAITDQVPAERIRS
jgi:hypothetical protein